MPQRDEARTVSSTASRADRVPLETAAPPSAERRLRCGVCILIGFAGLVGLTGPTLSARPAPAPHLLARTSSIPAVDGAAGSLMRGESLLPECEVAIEAY